MSLSAIAIEGTRPGPKSYKRYNEKSLFQPVEPNGDLLRRFNCRHAGEDKKLALGVYSEVGKKALDKWDEARSCSVLANGHG